MALNHKSFSQRLQRWLIPAIWVYFTLLFGWALLYLASGDRFSYVALLNNLAVYLFWPLPIALILAPFLRRREVWLGCALGVALFAWLWGELFIPRLGRQAISGSELKVMTFNVLGNHRQVAPIVATIRAEGADVVLIQELNPTLAAAIRAELTDLYPYQVLDPEPGVTGMGVISRYPLRRMQATLPLDWVGDPQLVRMQWEGRPVTLVNFHMYPSGLGTPGAVNYVNRAREDQARALAEFSTREAAQTPLIAVGDANVTDLSDAYRIVSHVLQDAWREAGFGLGHTFPGSDIPGSARPRIAGWPVPQWLARIDYIFYSPQWVATSAYLARVDGVSDHRGVIAVLMLP